MSSRSACVALVLLAATAHGATAAAAQPSGSLDASYGRAGQVALGAGSPILLADGRVLVGLDGLRARRLTTAGKPDPGFAPGSASVELVPGATSVVAAAAPDGGAILVGALSTRGAMASAVPPPTRLVTARLDAGGTPVPGPDGGPVTDLGVEAVRGPVGAAVAPDGATLVVTQDARVLRVAPDGRRDPAFGGAGGLADVLVPPDGFEPEANGIVVDALGRPVVTGRAQITSAGAYENFVAFVQRFGAQGQPDGSGRVDGYVQAAGATADPDGGLHTAVAAGGRGYDVLGDPHPFGLAVAGGGGPVEVRPPLPGVDGDPSAVAAVPGGYAIAGFAIDPRLSVATRRALVVRVDGEGQRVGTFATCGSASLPGGSTTTPTAVRAVGDRLLAALERTASGRTTTTLAALRLGGGRASPAPRPPVPDDEALFDVDDLRRVPIPYVASRDVVLRGRIELLHPRAHVPRRLAAGRLRLGRCAAGTLVLREPSDARRALARVRGRVGVVVTTSVDDGDVRVRRVRAVLEPAAG